MVGRRHPSDIQDTRLLAVLAKYVPPIIARSIVERARREAASGPEVSWADPNGLLDRISVGVRLFAAPEQQADILREISDLALADREGTPSSNSPGDDSPLPPSIHSPASRGGGPPSRSEPLSSVRNEEPGSGPPTTHRTPGAPPPMRSVFSVPNPRPSASGLMRTPGVLPPPSTSSSATPVSPLASPAIHQGMPRHPTPVSGTPRPRQGTPSRPDHPVKPEAQKPEQPREMTITLVSEHDIPRARQVAREICEKIGTRALTQQRLVTIVSELGRNMVLYAGGGKITLRPPLAANRRVVVIAVDQGSGIANLPEILAGKYKSKTGLGLGIVGTKRLADSFHIETSRHGTAISVEVIV